MTRTFGLALSAIFSCLFFFVLSPHAEAATLYFSPSSGTYTVGNTFSVGIYVNSSDEASNAYSGSINFSEDTLEVTEISKGGSIMSLWVAEPSYSNASGTVSFEGVVLNPGYSGSGGTILTVTFRAKATGAASAVFSSSEVLANDGFGTSILTGVGNASYTIISAQEAPEEEEEEVTVGEVPAAPTVSSSTHPDVDSWYANSTAEFSWKLPAGTTGVNVLADQEATTNPGTRSDGVFSSYSYDDVEDGIWYFHIRLQNSAGWGETTHFRFQIDTIAPDAPIVEIVEGLKTEDPQPSLILDSTDVTSGIKLYELVIDGNDPVSVDPGEATQANPYVLPLQAHGDHTLNVLAIDAAGNESPTTSVSFAILPLEPPKLTEYPTDTVTGRSFYVGGTTYPNSIVTLILTKVDSDGSLISANKTVERFTQTVETDENGNFRFKWRQRLSKGDYALQAYVTDARGATSEWTLPSVLEIGGISLGSIILGFGEILAWIVMGFTFLLLMLVLGHFARRFMVCFLAFRRKRREENEKERKRLFALKRRKLRGRLKTADRLLEKSSLHDTEQDAFEQIFEDFLDVKHGYRQSRRHKH